MKAYLRVGWLSIAPRILLFVLTLIKSTSESKLRGALLSLKLLLFDQDITFQTALIILYSQINHHSDPFLCPKVYNIILIISTMEAEAEKQYVLTDIMRKRKKDKQAVESKIKNKIALKGKRKKSETALKNPEKFIKQYRAQQKSYTHYRLKNKQDKTIDIKAEQQLSGIGKLLLVVRIRGVHDISKQQGLLLARFNLRKVNTAVFVRGTPANIRQLKRVENYIAWGEPSKKLVSELVYKKLYGKVGAERVQIKSNAQVEEHLGGDIICLEDIISQIWSLGSQFDKINNFVFPFKLTTPEGTLASRIRKPVTDNGHWGYRGEEISQYVQLMI